MSLVLPTVRFCSLRPLADGLVALALLLLAPAAANATDGVLEINQTCARQTGCFPGDTAGFPVTITNPGSYRLTSDLETNTRADSAIVISANDVTVDLGGFTIACTLADRFQPQACFGTGTGDGVSANGAFERTTIRNGRIVGMGRYGVISGHDSVVEDVHLASNGGGSGSGGGVLLARGSTLRNATVVANFGIGVSVELDQTGRIVDSTIKANEGVGISAWNGSLVRDCVVTGNEGHGILAYDDSTISGNSVSYNQGSGIVAYRSNLVSKNNSSQNGEWGLLLLASQVEQGLRSGYRENVFSGNSIGTVSGGVNMGSNLCDGSVACP